MTTPETPVDYGVARYVTASAFLRIPPKGPHGGKVLDLYGAGLPIPQGAMTEAQIKHYLEHGLIEHTDGKGNVDRYRVDECLSAIICCIADEPGCESWGRPRIAEAVRRAGFKFSTETLSRAIRRFHNPPQPEQD